MSLVLHWGNKNYIQIEHEEIYEISRKTVEKC